MENHQPITHSGRGFGGELEIVQCPLYRITLDGTSGLENILFTQSTKLTRWPNVSEALKSPGAILQSVQEAAAFRVCVGSDIDYSSQPQLTRTTALYFKRGKKYFVAFDDSSDENKNVALSIALPYFKEIEKYQEEVMRTHPKGGFNREHVKPTMYLPLSDKNVQDAIARAEEKNRLIELKRTNDGFGYETIIKIPIQHVQQISDNPFMNAIFGRVRKVYAKHTKKQYFEPGEKFKETFGITLMSPKWMDLLQKDFKESKDCAYIMSVALGRGMDKPFDVYAQYWPACITPSDSERMGYGRGVINSPRFLR